MNYDRTTIPDFYARGRHLSKEALRSWVDTIGQYLDATPSKILDVGCGTGRFSNALREGFEAHVVGIDPSWRMLSQAVGDESTWYVAGDGLRLPIRSTSVDFVFLSMVYHHLSDPMKASEEFWRVLEPGGCLCIRNSTTDHLDHLPYLRYFPSARKMNDQRLPSISSISRTVENTGFELRKHLVVPHQYAKTSQEYQEKLATRSLSDLAAIEDDDFEAGMVRLTADADNHPEPVFVLIDLFVFVRTELRTDA
jgi:ubiquinone/menaquinone biosynthesis C-methylase UbiE